MIANHFKYKKYLKQFLYYNNYQKSSDKLVQEVVETDWH